MAIFFNTHTIWGMAQVWGFMHVTYLDMVRRSESTKNRWQAREVNRLGARSVQTKQASRLEQEWTRVSIYI